MARGTQSKTLRSTSWKNIVNVYNNTIGRIPGVAEIDMERVRAAIQTVKDEAKETAQVFENEAVPATENLTQWRRTNKLSKAEETRWPIG